MALPTSGALTAAMINVELCRPSTVTFSMNGSDERALAGKPTGIIAFNDFYGKSFSSYTGTLDSTFITGTGFSWSPFDVAVNSTSVQDDNKVIAGGSFISYSNVSAPRLARLHSNGLLDNTFAVGNGPDDVVYSLEIQTDGKVIIVGMFTNYSGTGRRGIARINSNGLVDSDFIPGTGFNSSQSPFNTARTVSLQADGKIICGGSFTLYNNSFRNRIARLHSNGILDTTFNVGEGANDDVSTISIQSDGKVIIGGLFTRYNGAVRNRIARLHSNGILDTTFSVGTGLSGGFFPIVETISIQSDGKVIIGGGFTGYNGTDRNGIARLHSNGILDTNFSVGTGANGGVTTTLIQSDGKVIIGGGFTSYSGTTINRIARLHSNGLIDSSFDVGTGANDRVRTISKDKACKLIIGGGFTSYNGEARNRIARIGA
jgi:uncharacterized delta-60 repeat protein